MFLLVSTILVVVNDIKQWLFKSLLESIFT